MRNLEGKITKTSNLAENDSLSAYDGHSAQQHHNVYSTFYKLIDDTNSEMGPSIAFRNSYDKSMSAGLVSGAKIIVCTNGFFKGDLVVMRKHTGDADSFMNNAIFNQINGLQQQYEDMKVFANTLKEKELNKSIIHQLIGDLYLEEEAITSEQLNIFKREMFKPTFDYKVSKENSWNIYNILSNSIERTSHPSTYITQHKKLYNYFNDKILV
jgi:hypothetical protein